jgi:hypothetical protein
MVIFHSYVSLPEGNLQLVGFSTSKLKRLRYEGMGQIYLRTWMIGPNWHRDLPETGQKTCLK